MSVCLAESGSHYPKKCSLLSFIILVNVANLHLRVVREVTYWDLCVWIYLFLASGKPRKVVYLRPELNIFSLHVHITRYRSNFHYLFTMSLPLPASSNLMRPVLPSHGTATVKSVLSGDTVVLTGKPPSPGAKAPVVIFTFERVTAPR